MRLLKYLFFFAIILDLLNFNPKIKIEMRMNEQWEREDRLEDEIQASLNDLILDEKEDFKLIPEGTKILRILVIEDEVLIDFSKEICNYGGNYWEEELIGEILDKAFSFKEIKSVTIRIESKITHFVEGTSVDRYTREKWLKGVRDGE